MTQSINIVCKKCGSDEVVRNADVAWSIEYQCWEIKAIFDNADCEVCGGETTLEEVPIGVSSMLANDTNEPTRFEVPNL
jgi:hypothetical protein